MSGRAEPTRKKEKIMNLSQALINLASAFSDVAKALEAGAEAKPEPKPEPTPKPAPAPKQKPEPAPKPIDRLALKKRMRAVMKKDGTDRVRAAIQECGADTLPAISDEQLPHLAELITKLEKELAA